jgi:hypothetical protein
VPQNQQLATQPMIDRQYLGLLRSHQVVAYLRPLFVVSIIDQTND